MDLVKDINSDRISWCCQEYGITVAELGKKIGMAPNKLDEALATKRGITLNQLRNIAKEFDKGVLFFLESEPANEKIYSVNFRTIGGERQAITPPPPPPPIKALIERVDRHRDIYIGLREDSSEPPQSPWQGMNNFPQDKKTASIALFARDWLGLDEKKADFNTLRKAVQDKGILVFVSNGYKGKWKIDKESPVRGFSLYFDLAPVIFIKKYSGDVTNDGGKRIQSFTLMHELGHLLKHKKSFIDLEEDFKKHQGLEKEANEIAGDILVPKKYLDQLDYNRLSEAEANEFDDLIKAKADSWGVNTWVVMLRLLSEGKISQKKYNDYEAHRKSLTTPVSASISGGGSRKRHKEPLNIFGRHYVATVLDALNDKQITIVKASNFLDNLKIGDIQKLKIDTEVF